MGMKLDGGVEYAVDDNEVITFGQRVTSGTGMDRGTRASSKGY